jgi:hypothetical protein
MQNSTLRALRVLAESGRLPVQKPPLEAVQGTRCNQTGTLEVRLPLKPATMNAVLAKSN